MSSPADVPSSASTAPEQVSFPRLYARTMRFTLGTPTSVTVSPDGDRVLFLRSRSGTDRTGLLWQLDVGSGAESLLADPNDLLGGLDEHLPAAERARRERMRQGGAGITAYSTDTALDRATVALSGRVFVGRLRSGDWVEVPVAGPAVDPRLSPDGHWVAYHADGGVHVAPSDGSTPAQCLVNPDGPDVTWGVCDFVHAEELGRVRSFWWSPDSTSLLVARVDESPVQTWYIADPAHPQRPATPVRYPAAGTANPRWSLWHVTRDGVAAQVVESGVEAEYLATVSWTGAGPALIALLDRPQQRMHVLAFAPGEPVHRLREITDDCWVDVIPGVPAWWGDRLLTVERDIGADAGVLLADGEPVTPAGLHVRSVLAVTDRTVLVAIAEDDRQIRVGRVHTDGRWEFVTSGETVATGWGAGNTTVIREDSLDSCSAEVRVADGAHQHRIGVDAVGPPMLPRPRFLPRQRPDDPRVAVLVPDSAPGTAIPVLLDPYGGPHGHRVLAAARAYLEAAWWAEQGYVVVVADGPGSSGRPGWERAMAGGFAEVALRAQVRALEMVADLLDGLADLSRVAIRGWSFGGYLAALAVLERPDIVRAAIAGAPVTDWALYDTAYTERYLGHPSDHPGRYPAESLLERADRLRRPLMLIHGLADDNVVAAHTLRLSSALLAAGRPHRVLPLSGVTHMASADVVAENLLLAQRDFLAEALG